MIVFVLVFKILNLITSIFAFATTISFISTTVFTITCEGIPHKFSLNISYPFDLTHVGIYGPICNETSSQSFIGLEDSEASSAQFYVFVGVLAFLYCIGALVLYIFFDDLYRKNTTIVTVDFVISVVLTTLWLLSSSAWAQGVSNVKFYTDPISSGFFQQIMCGTDQCKLNSLGSFGGLNMSIIFGFLNFLVWLGNLWFLYKETPWFKIHSQPLTTQILESDPDSQVVWDVTYRNNIETWTFIKDPDYETHPQIV